MMKKMALLLSLLLRKIINDLYGDVLVLALIYYVGVERDSDVERIVKVLEKNYA